MLWDKELYVCTKQDSIILQHHSHMLYPLYIHQSYIATYITGLSSNNPTTKAF